jgi:hypothetical protein
MWSELKLQAHLILVVDEIEWSGSMLQPLYPWEKKP